ncbi:RAD18 ligase, partial [Furnarius figulus]|nr:RAD18 ligase [Furnarius figulus]
VDDLLRCGICFDYFSIAVIIPQCSHNYCSLCIRKFLSYKTQCPTCCVAVSESDLKNNRTLDELVKSFNSARQQLLHLVLDAAAPSPLACSQHPAAESHTSTPVSQPHPKEVPLVDSFLRKDKVCSSTKAGGLAGSVQGTFRTEECSDLHSTSAEAGGEDKVGSQEGPECTKSHEKPSTSVLKGVKKVECPVCEVAIPEQFINKHLDSCLTREEKKDSLRSSAHKRKPMPKVVYNLLSDRDLKKKLKEVGLCALGTRQQLIKRHQEFVHMYNAQCDSLKPKSLTEVVKELEKNEKIRVQLECNKPGENSLTFTKDQTEEEIDEIHAKYRNKHRKEFKFLVDQVSNRWKKSSERKPERAQSQEVAVQELPAATESRAEHHTAVVLGEAQELQSDTPDGQRRESCCNEEGQRSASPEILLSSGSSTSSTNSDILADVEESESSSASSD